MRISHVSYRGFRSLQNVDVNLAKYNTLIGKNDSGKSSFLLALEKLFDPQQTLADDDVCSFDQPEAECMVQATIEGCNHALAHNGSLVIRRSRNQGLEYKCQVPTDESVRLMFEGTFRRNSVDAFPEPIRQFLPDALERVSEGGRVTPEQSKELFRLVDEAGLVEYGDGWSSLDPQVLDSLVQVVFLSANMRGEEELQDNRTSVLTKVGGPARGVRAAGIGWIVNVGAA